MGQASNDKGSRGISGRLFWLGQLFLLVSVAASVVLVGKHLNILDAPGCGDGSPCDRAADSIWGKVPGIGWPVSFVGLAYFAALGFGWTVARSRGGVPGWFRWIVRVGVAFSVMFLAAMIFGGYVCPYCIAVHAGYFGFLFAVEAAPQTAGSASPVLRWSAAALMSAVGVTCHAIFPLFGEEAV